MVQAHWAISQGSKTYIYIGGKELLCVASMIKTTSVPYRVRDSVVVGEGASIRSGAFIKYDALWTGHLNGQGRQFEHAPA